MWNQGTVEGMDDRPSTWRMSEYRTGSGEAVNVLFNMVAPNWAKGITSLIWNRDNRPKIYGLPVINIR
jgi:hypothetical protein